MFDISVDMGHVPLVSCPAIDGREDSVPKESKRRVNGGVFEWIGLAPPGPMTRSATG